MINMYGNEGMTIGLSRKVKKLETIIRKLVKKEELDEKEKQIVENITKDI